MESASWKHEDELTDEEDDYLHGNCHMYAIENFVEGDIIRSLIELDVEMERNCLLHSFIVRDAEFIDVRGKTPEYEDILSAFDYGDFWEVENDNLKEFKSLLKKMGIKI